MTQFILSFGRSKEVYSYNLINEFVTSENTFFNDVQISLKEVINTALKNNEQINSDFKIIENVRALLLKKGYKSTNIYSNSIEFYPSEIEFDERIYYNLYQEDKADNISLFQFTVSSAIYLDELKRSVYSSTKDIDTFNSIVKKTIDENNGTEENNIINCIHENLIAGGAFTQVEFHEYFIPCKHILSKELLVSLGFSEQDWLKLKGNQNISQPNINPGDDLPF